MTDSHSTDMDKCSSSDCTQAENQFATKADFEAAFERIMRALDERNEKMRQGRIVSISISGVP